MENKVLIQIIKKRIKFHEESAKRMLKFNKELLTIPALMQKHTATVFRGLLAEIKIEILKTGG